MPSHHHHHHTASSSSSSATAAATDPTQDTDTTQLALLGRSLGPETVQHFSTNPYFCGSRSNAIKILKDVLAVVHEFKLLHRVATWGETAQKRLCVFGILNVTLGGAKDKDAEAKAKQLAASKTLQNSTAGSSPAATTTTSPSQLQQQASQTAFLSFLQPATSVPLGIPIQIWLSTNYPVDPPQCYIVPSGDPGEMLVANHPIVDRSGMIYAPLLASWNPAESTLVPLLKQFQRIFGVIPPLWIDDRPPELLMNNNNNIQTSIETGGNSSFAGDSLTNSPSGMLSSSSPALNNGSFGGGGALTSETSFGASSPSEDKMCVVCLCEEKDTVLVPCGHYCLCSSCSGSVQMCPICRCQIRLRQRVFL
jgi:hypothetical protein